MEHPDQIGLGYIANWHAGHGASQAPSHRGSALLRIVLLATALTACVRVQVPMTGYFAWSLLTNWEWAVGYTEQFGVVDVNFRTEERTLKASANYLAALFAGAGINATSPDHYD